ncbi:MAG: hypothetical protein KAR45_01425 [Desulfobacteraceae bacterium]|nr:hypothetical protein [Desulfobacteraceae bacterium]
MTFTKFGFFSFAGSILVLLFQGVSALMAESAPGLGNASKWGSITLGSITNGVLDQYINKIPYESIVNALDYTANTLEFFLLLGIIGVICFIIGGFRKV